MGQVFKSIIVNAPIDKVWSKLRNFHDGSWATGVIEDLTVIGDLSGDQIGARRKLNGVFTETLVALNDHEHAFSYSIDDAPGTPVAQGAVKDYVGTVKAHRITEGEQTFVEWKARWDGNDVEGAEFCGGIYGALLGAVKKSFE